MMFLRCFKSNTLATSSGKGGLQDPVSAPVHSWYSYHLSQTLKKPEMRRKLHSTSSSCNYVVPYYKNKIDPLASSPGKIFLLCCHDISTYKKTHKTKNMYLRDKLVWMIT